MDMSVYQYYVLVIYLLSDVEITIRGNKVLLNKGVYLYVGSCKGSGGIWPRIIRHLESSKKTRWHIDQLTTNKFSRIIGVFVIKGNDVDYESLLSNEFSKIFRYIPRFGSSDKLSDPSHLFICNHIIDKCLDNVVKVFEDKDVDYIWIHNA